MAGRKIEHLEESIRQKLGMILHKEANDPRFSLITITEVKLAKDLSFAKVRYACFQYRGDIPPLTDSLNKAAGFLGHILGRTFKARSTPKLNFEYDTAFDYAQEIDGVLNKLDIQEE